MRAESQKHWSVIKVQLCLSFQHTWKTHQGQTDREHTLSNTAAMMHTQRGCTKNAFQTCFSQGYFEFTGPGKPRS